MRRRDGVNDEVEAAGEAGEGGLVGREGELRGAEPARLTWYPSASYALGWTPDGDYFPRVFRQQQAGPLIGTRTCGGLLKSSVHYPPVDGGALTAPDNAVFDPVNGVWIAENQGVPPEIEVLLDARSVAEGRDPQLERGVEEALPLLESEGTITVEPPPYPRHAERPD